MGFQGIWSFRITEWGKGVELGPSKLEVWFVVPIQYEYPEDCCVNDTCCRSLKMYIIPLGFVSGCTLKEIKRKLIFECLIFHAFSVLGSPALPYDTYMNIRISHRTQSESVCATVKYAFKFKVCKSVHHHTIQINQPTRCSNSSSLLLDVYVQPNMFRASSRPSSGAQQLR